MPDYSLFYTSSITFDAAPRFGVFETQEIASIKANSNDPLSLRTWSINGAKKLVLTAAAAVTTLLAF